MQILLISSLLAQDYTTLENKCLFLAVLYSIVIIAIALDLWSGVCKAKRNHAFISSYGLRRTINKAAKYFNFLLCVTLIDIVLSAIPAINLPYVTMMVVCFICIIEIKSIWEKYDEKEKVRDAAKSAKIILDNKENISKILELFSEIKDISSSKTSVCKDEVANITPTNDEN